MRQFHILKNEAVKGKKAYFTPSLIKETTEDVFNPSRGWYEIYSFNIREDIDFNELKWSIRENQSLALIRINLKEVRDSSLSDYHLANLENILKFFCEAGKEIILRPAYDIEGNGRQNEPETFILILSHIRQMAPIIKKYNNNIFVFQGLLIGSWGEMHTSSYDSPENIKRLAAACRDYIGNDICMAVRRPVQLRYIISKDCEVDILNNGRFADKRMSNIGLFDDAIFASNSHLGTFGTKRRVDCDWQNTWCIEDELSFEEVICRTVPNGGEVIYGNMGCDASYVINLLQKMHISYLNCAYDKKLLDIWKNTLIDNYGIWNGISLYNYVGMHIGYRIVVRKVDVKVKSRTCAYVKVKLENVGFAPMYESTELALILQPNNIEKNAEKAKENIKDNKMHQIVIGEYTVKFKSAEASLKIQIPIKEGKLYLGMRRKKDGKWIKFATKSIADNNLIKDNDIIDSISNNKETDIDYERLLYIGCFT